MGINDFDDVVTKAHAHDMQVMVELIAGLPGETYDTWTENFCKLMSHENTSIESYPCWLLYNSELTSADSVQKFKIQKVLAFCRSKLSVWMKAGTLAYIFIDYHVDINRWNAADVTFII